MVTWLKILYAGDKILEPSRGKAGHLQRLRMSHIALFDSFVRKLEKSGAMSSVFEVKFCSA